MVSQLINEIQSSNEIEGVKSTRQEIEIAVHAQETAKDVRFKSTVENYIRILKPQRQKIESVEAIRKYYDEVVMDEFSEEDKPEGRLFRADKVIITDSASGKVIHQDNKDETEITINLT